ncbi:MAG: hypothetical protein Q9182_006404 [Xanthomendoza sp. 2 TL-2023]
MPGDAKAVHETSTATGFVSARRDALQKKPAASRNSPSPYPPAFPRARLERVQTYGDWPVHNAALYNQPHPRTMTLAPHPGLEKVTSSQHQHQEYITQEDLQVKSPPSRNLGVTGLKHLWESKGRSYNPFAALQHGSATSSCEGNSVGDQQSSSFAHIRTTTRDPPKRTVLPDSHREHHLMWGTKDLSDGPEMTNGSSNGSSEAEGHRLETSLDTDEPSNPSAQEAGRPSNKVSSLPDRKEPSINPDHSYYPDVRPLPRATAPAALTPRRSMSTKPKGTPKRTEPRFALNLQSFQKRCELCNPSSDETSTSSTEYHSMDQVEHASTARTHDNHWRNEEGSSAGPAPTLEHDMQAPAAPYQSSTLDAATQTDLLDEYDLAETSSFWSESELGAERQRHRMSHDHTSKPIRLVRRMRRQAVRKVQVVVSLDGATELVMGARLRRKRGERSCEAYS